MTKRILAVLLVLGALAVMAGADCANPCETYCDMQADCLDDLYDGDWTYSGYEDMDAFYDDCLGFYDLGSGPGMDRTEQNACKVAMRIFDEGYCS